MSGPLSHGSLPGSEAGALRALPRREARSSDSPGPPDTLEGAAAAPVRDTGRKALTCASDFGDATCEIAGQTPPVPAAVTGRGPLEPRDEPRDEPRGRLPASDWLGVGGARPPRTQHRLAWLWRGSGCGCGEPQPWGGRLLERGPHSWLAAGLGEAERFATSAAGLAGISKVGYVQPPPPLSFRGHSVSGEDHRLLPNREGFMATKGG